MSINWNPEQTSRTLRDTADAFVDQIQPAVSNFAQAATGVVIPASAQAVGAFVQGAIANNAPSSVAFITQGAINAATNSSVTYTTQALAPRIDDGVQRTADLAKQSSHFSTDRSVDLCARIVTPIQNGH